MKALSIRSPWWAWIVYGGKIIENRTWRHSYRGPVLIHVSKWWHDIEVSLDNANARILRRDQMNAQVLPSPVMSFNDMQQRLGHCVAIVDVVDCVSSHPSPWFVGPYGFVLANPRPIEPFRVRGERGFFEVAYAA